MENKKALTIRLPKELADWIDQYAKENRWSRNIAITVLVEKAKEDKAVEHVE